MPTDTEPVPIPAAVDDCDYSPRKRARETDGDGDGWGVESDCDDSDPAIHPYAVELDDGVDDNCDGSLLPVAQPVCAVASGRLHGHWQDSAEDGPVDAVCAGSYGTVAMGMTARDGEVAGVTVVDGLGGPISEAVFRYREPYRDFPGNRLAFGRFMERSDGSDLVLAGFEAEVIVVSAPLPPDVDEVNAPLILAEEDRYGNAQQIAAGDVNGDGVDDLLLGQAGFVGQVASIFYGPLDALRTRSDADWFLLMDDTETMDDWVHPQLVSVGDTDGDGRNDVAFGDTWWYSHSGAVAVVTSLNVASTRLADAPFRFSGGDSDAEFGNATCAGDFDGDGTLDLAAGGFFTDAKAGRVDVVYGPLVGQRSVDDSDLALAGEQPDNYLGFSIACGDTDGDRRTDVLVGSPGYGTTTRPGLAYLLTDIPGISSLADASRVFSGAHDDQELGWSVALADLDHNGRDDLVLGAPDSDVGPTNSGSVYMVYSP